MSSNTLRLGLVQLAVTASKAENLKRASKLIGQAVGKGAKVVSLPECFNSPYGNQYFAKYAEPIPGETTNHLGKVAKEYGIFLIGGSIPEKDGDNYFNTCPIFNPDGELIATYRKVHLFNIDIPGKITVKESETLKPGNTLTTIEAYACKIGIGICFDIRYPELANLYAKQGCQLLIYPGAFNMTTGPAHWKLLQQARAADNQLFIASVSPARDETASYVSWGHSMVVNPWGTVLSELDQEEGVLCTDIDLGFIEEIRKQLPVTVGRRNDLYDTKLLNP